MDSATRSRERLPLVVVGALAVGLAFVAGQFLAVEAWSPGALGFPLLLALPGLWVLLQAFDAGSARVLGGAAALAFMLLGLDVADSSRFGVVFGGWLMAGAGVLVMLACLAVRSSGSSGRGPMRRRNALR